MADQRVFTLIGNFTDNITPALVKINTALAKVKTNIAELSQLTKPLKNDFRELAGLSKDFSNGLKAQAADLRAMTSAMKSARQEMGRMNRAYRAGGSRVARSASRYAGMGGSSRFASLSPRSTRSRYASRYGDGMRFGGGGGDDGGGGGRSRRMYGEGRDTTQNIVGDVVSGNLITNAIVSGFQMGTQILQQGVQAAFGAFAERAKDQLEDIGAAGGIFSAGKFANVPGLPKTFQDAMKMQDGINKDMAAIASNLPGTTHDYVENSRRLVDTTAQIMAKDLQGFTKLAQELTGKATMSGQEAFRAVNVEISKATTLLEKMNPSKTVIPMTQIVEDMLKSEQVSIGGLRKYVAFKRGTTFEAALTRNLEEVNKAGAGTAARLKAIVKVLKEAVPAEMVVAFQSSVGGVVEGFKSAFLDPDVGLFGLSRTLTLAVKEFDKETGQYLGKYEFTNFFKMFSEVFGNIGNLINTAILPGLSAIYEPFKAVAASFIKLREYSFKIFRAQQEYTAAFENLAAQRGMKKEDFKVFEKGGVSALIGVLKGFNAIDEKTAKKAMELMRGGNTAKQVEENMRLVYKDIIPAVMKSPFFAKLGETLGSALGTVLKEVANLMKAVLHQEYGQSQFVQSFQQAGGLTALNDILVLLAEAIMKAIVALVKLFGSTLVRAATSGNLLAAGLLATVGVIISKSIMGFVQGCMSMFGKGAAGACPMPGVAPGGRRTNRLRSNTAKVLSPVGTALAPAGPVAMTMMGMTPKRSLIRQRGMIGGAARGMARSGMGGPLVAGAVNMGIALATGENLGRAAASTIGTVLGGAIGTIINPGLGTMIGGAAGSFIGDAIYDNFAGPGAAQKEAARLQEEAAKGQLRAAGIVDLGEQYGLTLSNQLTSGGFKELQDRLKALGYAADPLVQTYTKEYAERNVAQEKFKQLNEQLQTMTASLKAKELKPEEIEARTKPIRDAIAAQKIKLEKEQGELDKAWKALPNKVTDALLKNIDNVSWTKIGEILAQGARNAAAIAAGKHTTDTRRQLMPSTQLAPNNLPYQGPPVPTPPKKDKRENEGWKRTSTGSGWKRSSIGEGDCITSMGGKTVGGVNAFNPMASSYGLTLTSGYRPGSPGWHGVDRARDYSNGYGPTPQMMRFAQFLATNYGDNLKELIYTPLGFSIKNGRKVAPYAQAAHYNHVHVAYATGFPTFGFPTQAAAVDWEKKATMGNVSVASITAREGEFGGKGAYTFNNNITINQQPGENIEQLTARVLTVFEGWVEDATNSAYFV